MARALVPFFELCYAVGSPPLGLHWATVRSAHTVCGQTRPTQPQLHDTVVDSCAVPRVGALVVPPTKNRASVFAAGGEVGAIRGQQPRRAAGLSLSLPPFPPSSLARCGPVHVPSPFVSRALRACACSPPPLPLSRAGCAPINHVAAARTHAAQTHCASATCRRWSKPRARWVPRTVAAAAVFLSSCSALGKRQRWRWRSGSTGQSSGFANSTKAWSFFFVFRFVIRKTPEL